MTTHRAARSAGRFGLLFALAAAIPFLARTFEPHARTPIPQLAAFAPWAVPLGLTALVLLGVATPVRFGRPQRRTGEPDGAPEPARRRWLLLSGRPPAAAVAVLLVLALAVAVGVHRQWPPAIARPAGDDPDGSAVTVMTINAKVGQVDADQVLDAVRRHRVDVLVVEELPAFTPPPRTGTRSRCGGATCR